MQTIPLPPETNLPQSSPVKYLVTRCVEPRRNDLSEFARKILAVKDFSYTWTLWGNWDKHAPFIAMEPETLKIIGFHAVTFSEKSGYLNSYYQAVAPEWQGKGVAGMLVNCYLAYYNSDLFQSKPKRLKFKTPFNQGQPGNSAGTNFWLGFGLKPYAVYENPKHQEYLWDVDISQVSDVASLIEWMKQRDRHAAIPPKEVERVKKLKYPVRYLDEFSFNREYRQK